MRNDDEPNPTPGPVKVDPNDTVPAGWWIGLAPFLLVFYIWAILKLIF